MTGTISRPCGVSCSIRGGGISGQAAVMHRVVGRMPRISQSAVVVNEEHVGVARTFQVLAREREGCGVDIDRHDQTHGAHHLPRQGGAVARADANLEEPVPHSQAERLIEQRIAVRA
jgi:hypothetical protein